MDVTAEDARPRKRQRKQRPCYSCAECRRLKMKCDRQSPCSNCTRRQRVAYCVPANGDASLAGSTEPVTARGSDVRPLSSEPGGNKSMSQRVTEEAFIQEDHDASNNDFQTDFEEQIHLGSHAPDRPNPHEASKNQSRLDQHTDFANATRAQGDSQSLCVDEVHASHLQGHHLSPKENAGIGASSTSPLGQSTDNGLSESYGTLMLGKGGRSKYLGPTAGSEWLKESETQEAVDTPNITRAPSPVTGRMPPAQARFDRFETLVDPVSFPFNSSGAHVSTRELLSSLPPRDESWTLAESYYRYCAWHHDVAPKKQFEKVFDRVYSLAEGSFQSGVSNAQELALVYIIIAQGTMFNIEMPNNDSSAEDWLHLSERALVKGEFLSNNTLAGIQTLHLMAHLHLQLDKGRRGDNAWPLWGLVMRLIQAMGMHRDPGRWNLPQDVAEERRKVFWECNAADTFQAHCFSRPSAINPEHCDTAFPSEPLNNTGDKTYSILRFELSQLSSEILNMAMKVRKPSYSDVVEMDTRLSEFEHQVPFALRCRAALLAMPSRYAQAEAAVEASPEPSRRSMTLSFQQTNIALNISETIINLHRPYYAKALYDKVESVESVYAPSYLTVIERCALLISIVTDIHARFPAVSIRQWNLWYHVFGSALCLGTLVLKEPQNVMSSFVLSQIDASISLFTSLNEHGANTPRYKRNLQWLLKLRTRAQSKISSMLPRPATQGQTESVLDAGGATNGKERDHAEDIELLGWRTRLIERAGQGHQKSVRTIIGSTNTSIASPALNEDFLNPAATTNTGKSAFEPPQTTPDSTNDLLGEFWDPMLLHDLPSNDPFTDIRNTWWWDGAAAGLGGMDSRPM